MNTVKSKFSYQEILFQVILHLITFFLYTTDQHESHTEFFESFEFAFFFNYVFASFIVNYYLLPHLLYKKKYLGFSIGICLLIGIVMFVEESVLERIYFPNSRGKHFPGVFHTLFEVLPVITILSGAKFAWDALRKQKEVEELKAAMEESELQFLKTQINPHFLFNNLNNLYSYAIDNSPKVPTIILELSAVLRYMLYECKEKFVPLSKEIEQLENFTKLNELQIEERGIVNFNTSGIDSGFEIAPLILIVFIENAFKHSQSSQSENIFIDIQVILEEDGKLHFYCENNFQSTSNTESLSRGIGLKNVKKRLELLYPLAHQLDILETENHYEVHLSIQLNQSTNELYYY